MKYEVYSAGKRALMVLDEHGTALTAEQVSSLLVGTVLGVLVETEPPNARVEDCFVVLRPGDEKQVKMVSMHEFHAAGSRLANETIHHAKLVVLQEVDYATFKGRDV